MKTKKIRKILKSIAHDTPPLIYNYIVRNKPMPRLVENKDTGKMELKVFNKQTKQVVVSEKCQRGLYKDMKRTLRGKSSRAFLLSQTQVSS